MTTKKYFLLAMTGLAITAPFISHAGVLFNIPTTTDLIADIGEVSSPIFDEFWPLLKWVLGVGVLVLLIALVIKGLKG